MLVFLSLQTNSNDRRSVSFTWDTRSPDVCRLLGNLPHQTEFTCKELVEFAEEVIDKLKGEKP